MHLVDVQASFTREQIRARERATLTGLADDISARLDAPDGVPSCSEWHWTLRRLRTELLDASG